MITYRVRFTTTCPNCGAPVAMTRKEIENMKEIRLQEIKQTRREKAVETVKGKDYKDCRTLMELQAWAKQNGKSSGWAWHVWRGRMERV